MGKIIKWLFFGFVSLLILGAIIEGNKTPEQKAAEQARREQAQQLRAEQNREIARAEQASLPSYAAKDLARAYEENTVAADVAFKNKKFKVTGTVDSINTDIFGNPYLTLRGGVNQFMEPQFSFDESAAQQLSTLKKGSKVELICIGKGDVAKIPMSGDCTML